MTDEMDEVPPWNPATEPLFDSSREPDKSGKLVAPRESGPAPANDCWRVVRVERYVEAVDDETYDTADRAAAAAFAWRTRYPNSEFEIERA